MLDTTDIRLIELLETDARQSPEMLARQLKVSSSTIRRRLKKLIDSGVLRLIAFADPELVGLPFMVVIALDVAIEKLQSTVQALGEQQEIRWVSTTSGRFDIIALARFSSAEAFYDFMQDKMANMEGLKNTETFICLHIEKGLEKLYKHK